MMRPSGWRRAHGEGRLSAASVCAATVAGLAALAIAGCSSGVGELAGVGVPYQHSNAIMPSGYSETQLGPDRYRIEVKGPLTAPRERLEKIAATRAAEIGKDNHLGYFKIEGVQHSTYCKSYTAGAQNGGKDTKKKQLQYAVLTADVAYAKTPPDASYVQAKPAFEQYRAELEVPQPAGLAADPAAIGGCSS